MSNSFNVAPGVYFTERDATLATASGLTMAAGHVGRFQWGPVEEVVSITGGEDELVSVFYKPARDSSGIDQLCLHDYFNYANSAAVARVFAVGATNAIATGDTATLIKNSAELKAYTGSTKQFAKYPGTLGNNLAIYVMDETLRQEIKADYDLGFRSGAAALWPNLSDKAVLSDTEYNVFVLDTSGAITGLAVDVPLNHKSLTVELDAGDTVPAISLGASTFPIDLTWDGESAPTSEAEFIENIVEQFAEVTDVQKTRNNIRAIKLSGADKLEVEFINSLPADGAWFDDTELTNGLVEETVEVTGLGNIIETPYERISSVEGSTDTDTGLPNDFIETINENSSYVGFGPSWSTPTVGFIKFQGGSDGSSTQLDYYTGQELLNNSTIKILGFIDVSYDIGSQQTAIDLAVKRRDCVSFVAPPIGLRSKTSTTAKFKFIKDWKDELLRDNSYFFATDNWAEVYDSYNKIYRYIPTSGGTCGLWFRSISKVGTGKSPAFLNRGKYLNYRKLDWTADDDQVAVIYNDYQVNSIREMDEGIILWGDRTGLSKKSAFNRINVRGVFIDCETAIATTAKYTLGENNDTFTRALFNNAVIPFLRAKKEGGEIEDFYVKTDSSNNTAQVIVNNEFVSGIFIKPKYSINFIYLDFVSVRPDVQFSEIENVG